MTKRTAMILGLVVQILLFIHLSVTLEPKTGWDSHFWFVWVAFLINTWVLIHLIQNYVRDK